jgi:hypothetical protein
MFDDVDLTGEGRSGVEGACNLMEDRVIRRFVLGAMYTLPTKAAPPNPSVGADTRTHSTLLTLSSLLLVKGLTRGWYGGEQRLISWLHPCSASNVALNTRTCAHGPLMGYPNWVGCDIHPLKEPDVLVGPTHPSSADPYAMSCAPSQAHTRMHMSAHLPEQMSRNLPS